MTKEDAEREVLGVTTNELGLAVARRWAFPDSIIQSMRRLLGGPVKIPRTRGEWLHAAAAFANELADEAGPAEPEFERLVQRYGDALDISSQRIGNLLRGIAGQVRIQVDALEYFAGVAGRERGAARRPRSNARAPGTEVVCIQNFQNGGGLGCDEDLPGS